MHADTIRLAGGLRPNPDDWFIGGLWVIEADIRQQAQSLCENDPYFKLGLRKVIGCAYGAKPLSTEPSHSKVLSRIGASAHTRFFWTNYLKPNAPRHHRTRSSLAR